VVIADYSLLRTDFPEPLGSLEQVLLSHRKSFLIEFLRSIGELSETGIDDWIIDLCTAARITTDTNTIVSSKSMLRVSNLSYGNSSVNGVGSYLKNTTHGLIFSLLSCRSGLVEQVSLTAAIYSFLTQRIVEKVLERQQSTFSMIR